MKNGGLKAVMCIDFQGFCMQQSTIMNFSFVLIHRHYYSSVALNVSIVCVGFTSLARSQFIPATLSAMGGKKFSLVRVRKSSSSSSNGRRKVSGRPPKGRKQTKVSLS